MTTDAEKAALTEKKQEGKEATEKAASSPDPRKVKKREHRPNTQSAQQRKAAMQLQLKNQALKEERDHIAAIENNTSKLLLEHKKETRDKLLEHKKETRDKLLEHEKETHDKLLEKFNETKQDILGRFDQTKQDILGRFDQTKQEILENVNETERRIRSKQEATKEYIRQRYKENAEETDACLDEIFEEDEQNGPAMDTQPGLKPKTPVKIPAQMLADPEFHKALALRSAKTRKERERLKTEQKKQVRIRLGEDEKTITKGSPKPALDNATGTSSQTRLSAAATFAPETAKEDGKDLKRQQGQEGTTVSRVDDLRRKFNAPSKEETPPKNTLTKGSPKGAAGPGDPAAAPKKGGVPNNASVSEPSKKMKKQEPQERADVWAQGQAQAKEDKGKQAATTTPATGEELIEAGEWTKVNTNDIAAKIRPGVQVRWKEGNGDVFGEVDCIRGQETAEAVETFWHINRRGGKRNWKKAKNLEIYVVKKEEEKSVVKRGAKKSSNA